MLKLDLRQNALHTLHHAVEHLQWSEDTSRRDERSFDHDDRSVSWKDQKGHLCFAVPEFTRLPSGYNLKFSVLHLIQASELLLKSYVEQCDPAALFVRPGSTKTINLQQALEFTIKRNPTLLTPAEVALLLEAKRFRNAIEHYRFEMSEDLRAICVDFLAVCMLLAQALLLINIADVFSWDYLCNEPDKVADYLTSILAQISERGRCSARKTGELWVSENPSQPVFLCLNCGARAVSRDRGVCMGCGSEGDEEIVELLEDFETAEMELAELQKRLPHR